MQELEFFIWVVLMPWFHTPKCSREPSHEGKFTELGVICPRLLDPLSLSFWFLSFTPGKGQSTNHQCMSVLGGEKQDTAVLLKTQDCVPSSSWLETIKGKHNEISSHSVSNGEDMYCVF